MRAIKHVLCVSATVVLLAGCGGSQLSKSSSDVGQTAPKQAQAAAGSAAKQAAGSQATSGPVNVTSPADRSVVYTATLSVRAKDVESSVTKAKQLVTAAGGYVGNETGSTEPVSANLTFKVPADRYATVLEQLAGQLGTKLSLQQQAEDVTEQVADVDSRVKSAQATLQMFRKILDRANTIGEVLNVEQEISQREADLEALQARQKSLAQQARYATVTLRLEAPGKQAAPPKPAADGFLGGLKSGWHAFTAVLSVVVTLLGWLLPFLVVAALIGLPVWKLRNVRRRSPVAAPTTTPPTPDHGERVTLL